MDFSPNALRRARKRYGHTQQQAAFEMHTAMSTIQMWEGGRREPKGLYRERVLAYIRGAAKTERTADA